MSEYANISIGTLDPSYCGTTPDFASDYAPRMGLPVLRQLIAQRHLVPPERVVVLAGASMALTCCFLAAQLSNRPVLIPRPGFPAYAEVLRLLRREVGHYDLGKGWINSVQQALKDRNVGTLLLNSPGNPMGNVIDDADRELVIAMAAEKGATVILDETYAGLEFPGSGSSGALVGEAVGVIRIGSFSKRFAAPGLRVGYAIAEPSTARQIADVNWSLAMSPGGASQIAAAELMVDELKHPDRAAWMAGALENASLNAIAALSRHGVKATKPEGGPLLWIVLPHAPGSGANLAAYCQKNAGILVNPGEAFGHSGPAAMRCCYALPPDQVTPVFDRLGAVLAAYSVPAADHDGDAGSSQ